MSFSKKVTLAILILVFVSGIFIIYSRAHRIEYVTLYNGLEVTDAGTIVEKLKSSKVPYRISNEGKVISVPPDKVEEVRLQLAKEGLPKSEVGYEIFDKKTWGMTDFVEKINYKRALEGELARTIGELKEVESARVHLVLPEEKLFKEDKIEPSASVMLKLKPGFKLSAAQSLGIAKLIAHGIEGLITSNVTIIDFNGDILFSGETETSPDGVLSSQIQTRKETGGTNISPLSCSNAEVAEKKNAASNPIYRYSWILILPLATLLLYIVIRWLKGKNPPAPVYNFKKAQTEIEPEFRKSEFGEIKDSNIQTYFEILKAETPHNIAIILSQLPNHTGIAILNYLPPEKRGEVALCLSRVEQVAPEIKERVMQAFESLMKSGSEYSSLLHLKDQVESGKTEVEHLK